MKILKKEKGITLIALIITIVVLLILAGVAIGTLDKSNIIEKAQSAVSSYEEEKVKENQAIKDAEDLLDKYTSGNSEYENGQWELQDDYVTIKNVKTGETKKIGDEITNDEVLAATKGTKSTYTGTWTVLGAENGKLKLVTTSNVVDNVPLGKTDSNAPSELEELIDGSGYETSLDTEKAIWSYQNAVNTLNKHAQDATGITSARSIKLEDIEKEEVLNITNDKKVELSSDYGMIYNYFYDEEELKVLSRNKATENEDWSNTNITPYEKEVFVDKDNKIVIVDSEGDEVIIENNDYNMYTFTDKQSTQYANSLANGFFWLASCSRGGAAHGAGFYVRAVVAGNVASYTMFDSYGYAYENSMGVRAVVYI